MNSIQRLFLQKHLNNIVFIQVATFSQKKNKKMLLDDIYISFVYKTYKIFLQLEYMFGVCYNFATSVQYFYCL